MRYDLVVFDFDGTLVDSGDWFFGSLNDVADRFGFRRTSVDEREALRRLGNREIIRRLRVPAWRMPAIARHMRRRAAEDIDLIRLFDGIETSLATLGSQGARMAIVSSNAESNVRTVLGSQLADRIDAYARGASMFGKAAKLKRVIKDFGIAPARTICVGDETRDIEAAQAIGAASAAVTWGYAAADALERLSPTMMLHDVRELATLAG